MTPRFYHGADSRQWHGGYGGYQSTAPDAAVLVVIVGFIVVHFSCSAVLGWGQDRHQPTPPDGLALVLHLSMIAYAMIEKPGNALTFPARSHLRRRHDVTHSNASYGEGPHTEAKLDIFANLLKMHMDICNGQRWCRDYRYVDMNAGPGIAPLHQVRGSPLIFLDTVRRYHLPYAALMVELEIHHALALREHCSSDKRVEVEQGDHSVIVPRYVAGLRGQPNGMIYHDPNGVPSWDALQAIFQKSQARYLDLVMYIRTNDVRRVNGYRFNRGIDDYTLADGITAINKKFWLIREPVSNAGWTFLIGTNWDGYPEWRANHFYWLHSREGRAILARQMYRPKIAPELDQQTLPFDQGE